MNRPILCGVTALYKTRAMLDYVYQAFAARIVFGTGKISLIGEEADRLDASSILMVCTNSQKSAADTAGKILGARVTARIDGAVEGAVGEGDGGEVRGAAGVRGQPSAGDV